MTYLILILAGTVPLEFPYFDIVKREVSLIPRPEGIDTSTYNRELELTYREDSTNVIVEGLLVERWLDGDTGEISHTSIVCDSVKIKTDTVFAYSGLVFEFTASYANVISAEMIAGMRGADADNHGYKVRDILSRLGLGRWKYRKLADAGSLVTVGFKRKPGMVFMNLATGAVIGMEMREPVTPVPVTHPDP